MELSDLNTSKFIHDPKSPDFLNELERHEEFKFNIDKLNKKKLCVYITLMCDPQSDIRKSFSYYPTRKREAALCAGFKIGDNNKFPQNIENILVGENKDFNKAYIKYLSLAYDPNFTRLNVYQKLQNIVLLNALSSADIQSVNLADKLTAKLKEEEQSIFGGEEVLNIRQALYEKAAIKELDFKPEDVAYRLSEGDELEDFSQYGKGYKVDEPKFKGDAPPRE